MKHVVLLSLTIAIASIAEIRDVQGSSDYAILRKSSGATAGKGDAGVQPKGGGSLSAPADRRLPVIDGGGSLKQPCGMGHLGCLDGDPPSGKGFNPKK